jgi:4-hydroxybutyrate CoA-transferase
MPIVKNATECVSLIRSGDNVFIHSGVSAPQQLLKAMLARSSELRGVKTYQMHTEGSADYAKKEFTESFQVHNFFNGANMRQSSGNISAHYVPIFLSEIPLLFYNGIIQLDVALIQVSPPDSHGMCSLGPSVDITISAVKTAKIVIAQVNRQMPRTFGDSQIHISQIHTWMEVDEPLHRAPPRASSEVEMQIGKNIASLIEDGSTLQLGIGAIPDAVLSSLKDHKNLGVHTEMFSDGVIDLYHSGVINNRFKMKHPGKIVSSFVIGSQRVYDFIDDNPAVLLLDCAYTNSTHVIAQNPKVIAINSAIEVDITGQVCADSIGHKIYSGIGGQMDFMRGAALSKGGKPIIALPAKTSKGDSKITTFLKPGAGVVTTRAHVHYVVTEYGIAYLYGKTLEERATAMIEIAAPEHRERLKQEAAGIFT